MNMIADRRAKFRALHQTGCFVLPNPWDIGSARLLQHMGFSALASTSSGHAWTTGRPDYGVTRDDTLVHLTALCAAVDAVIASGAPLSVGDLAISGTDLRAAGVAPGPRMGEILRTLLDLVLDDPSLNARDTLLARAKALA